MSAATENQARLACPFGTTMERRQQRPDRLSRIAADLKEGLRKAMPAA